AILATSDHRHLRFRGQSELSPAGRGPIFPVADHEVHPGAVFHPGRITVGGHQRVRAAIPAQPRFRTGGHGTGFREDLAAFAGCGVAVRTWLLRRKRQNPRRFMATKYDAIIIGGGHNGLVTACYLARAKWKVLVLERRYLVGGACVTEENI